MTEVIAHRGANRPGQGEHRRRPSGSPSASGSTAIELDARRTADGVVVVHHDAQLDDGRADRRDARGRELPGARPDAGRGPRRLRRRAGQRRDQERRGRARLRPARPRRRRGRWPSWPSGARRPDAGSSSSFRLETVDRCHALDPGLPTAWLVTRVDETTASTAAERGHAALNPWESPPDGGRRRALPRRRTGRQRVDVNDPARAVELVEWGVDGIVTDVPDVDPGALGR